MKRRGNLRQIRHAASAGQSAAVRSGVRAAHGAIVATLDGDGQNNPAFLPELIAAIDKGGERVGHAAGQRVGRKDTGFKKIQSRIANAVRNAILRDPQFHSGQYYDRPQRPAVGLGDEAERAPHRGPERLGQRDRRDDDALRRTNQRKGIAANAD